jgi:hypothetical protein
MRGIRKGEEYTREILSLNTSGGWTLITDTKKIRAR